MAFHRKLSDISNTPSSCTIASHASHSADSVKHCYTAPPALTSILLTRSTNSTTNELSSAQSVHRAPLLTCALETPRFCSRPTDWHSLCLAGPSRAAQPIQPERPPFDMRSSPAANSDEACRAGVCMAGCGSPILALFVPYWSTYYL